MNDTVTNHVSAIITRNDGPRFWADLNGTEIPCTLRGRLKQEQLRVTSLLVVGDQVELALQPGGSAVIESITPRRTELSRPGFHGYVHVMAANVDQMLIVVAAMSPAFKRHTVERFVAAAHRGGITPVVVVNKCDLRVPGEVELDVAPLRQPGAHVLLVSAATGLGLDELRQSVSGRISVLAGQSGVGKSSLITALFPELNLRTGRVSDTGKGRHTTTNSRLIALPGGGYLADTPGIREIGLFDPQEELSGVFPEIAALAGGCKFRNCTHTHEPQCAVKAAAQQGQIDPDRLAHYQRLLAGE